MKLDRLVITGALALFVLLLFHCKKKAPIEQNPADSGPVSADLSSSTSMS